MAILFQFVAEIARLGLRKLPKVMVLVYWLLTGSVSILNVLCELVN